jgi:hypothetical protein
MSPGQHNVSSRSSVRLAECQTAENALGTDEDRRRFWAKVRVTDSDKDCWLWTAGKTSNGRYGQFMWASVYGRYQPVGAHRAAWELTHGRIGADLHIIHSCDVPLCVNPSHLSVGTHTENMQDASRKGRLNVARPSRQKLTDAQILEMLARYQAGEASTALAVEYGCTKAFISQLVNGKRRQWLNPTQFQRSWRGGLRRKAVA